MTRQTFELWIRYWLPVLILLTLIRLESTDTMSGEHTGHLLGGFLLRLGLPMAAPVLDLLNLILRKCGHFLGYGALCLCWLRLLRGSYWLRREYQLSLGGRIGVFRLWWRAQWGALAILLTFVAATADELHQMGIPSRGGEWSDVWFDTAAAAVAAALVYLHARRLCLPTPNA